MLRFQHRRPRAGVFPILKVDPCKYCEYSLFQSLFFNPMRTLFFARLVIFHMAVGTIKVTIELYETFQSENKNRTTEIFS